VSVCGCAGVRGWVCVSRICGFVIYQCYRGGTSRGSVPRRPFDRLCRPLGRTKCDGCRGSGAGGGGRGRRYRGRRRGSCGGGSGGGGGSSGGGGGGSGGTTPGN